MCWSGEASVVLSAIGVGTTLWAVYKKEPPELYIPLFYFTLMEILQAYTYSVIGQCQDPSNQIATLLGYLHIAFQPFFINCMGMYFIRKEVKAKIAPYVYTACFAATILMLLRVYPFQWAIPCEPGSLLCGLQLCSVHGNWHIAWEVPYNLSIFGGWSFYSTVGVLLPILYGSWKASIYNVMAGPFLAYLTTTNPNEQPAVWCLFSIGLIIILIKTPVRNMLFVNEWPLWPKSWLKPVKNKAYVS